MKTGNPAMIVGREGRSGCRPAIAAAIALMAAIAPWHAAAESAVAGTVVRFNTSLGLVNVELLDSLTPITVANFLTYTSARDYDNTFIHRSAKTSGGTPFVIQGGGYSIGHFNTLPTAPHITERPPIQNEPHESNVRGTIAMAKGTDPNSATSEWFFNLGNNSALDAPDRGAFTVFGRVLGNNMTVVDAIAALPTHNFGAGTAFNEVPLRNFISGTPNFTSGTTPNTDNAVSLFSVAIVPPWQNPLDRLDVSNNTFVGPQDALIVINDFNARGTHSASAPYVGPYYLDVNGDGRIEQGDVTPVIDFLNAQPPSALAAPMAGGVRLVEAPEPSGLVLALALAGLAACGLRRRD